MSSCKPLLKKIEHGVWGPREFSLSEVFEDPTPTGFFKGEIEFERV